jgi:hypothetical protein
MPQLKRATHKFQFDAVACFEPFAPIGLQCI